MDNVDSKTRLGRLREWTRLQEATDLHTQAGKSLRRRGHGRLFLFLRSRLALRIAALAALVGLGFWAWQYRHVATPLVDAWAAWRAGSKSAHEPVSLQGTVVAIADPTTVTLEIERRQLFNVKLAALEPVAPAQPLEARRDALARTRFCLSQLVLSNEVRAQLIATNAQRVGLGVVYLGPTNINAALLASGTVRLAPEWTASLSFPERYALFRAARLASQRPPPGL